MNEWTDSERAKEHYKRVLRAVLVLLESGHTEEAMVAARKALRERKIGVID